MGARARAMSFASRDGRADERNHERLRAMCAKMRAFEGVANVDAREALAMKRATRERASGALVFVDTRTMDERETSTIAGAMSAEEYERTRTSLGAHECVCFCTIGARSGAFAERMAKVAANDLNSSSKETKYYNMVGSILAWTHAGGDVVDARGEVTKKVHTFGKTWDLAPSSYETVYFKHPVAKGLGHIVRGWFGK